ncbi:rhomboid family intramembrane serine protease [Candidatus Micrarchaeota archaeon]|nr:rhomboid family intramembrane serine protease [Candidatus Micrarchaeota archaeon]
MLYHYVLALVFLISIAGTMFPFLMESPLSLFTSLFFFSNLFALFPAALGLFFLGRGVETRLGSQHFLLLWILPSLIGSSLQASGSGFAFDASASIMALLGATVALSPMDLAVVEVYPVPAFVAAIVILMIHVFVTQDLNIVPLLVGLAYGYVALLTYHPTMPPQAPYPRTRF